MYFPERFNVNETLLDRVRRAPTLDVSRVVNTSSLILDVSHQTYPTDNEIADLLDAIKLYDDSTDY